MQEPVPLPGAGNGGVPPGSNGAAAPVSPSFARRRLPHEVLWRDIQWIEPTEADLDLDEPRDPRGRRRPGASAATIRDLRDYRRAPPRPAPVERGRPAPSEGRLAPRPILPRPESRPAPSPRAAPHPDRPPPAATRRERPARELPPRELPPIGPGLPPELPAMAAAVRPPEPVAAALPPVAAGPPPEFVAALDREPLPAIPPMPGGEPRGDAGRSSAGRVIMVDGIIASQPRPVHPGRRRLRLAAAAAIVAILAVGAYRGSDMIAGLAGATPHPAPTPPPQAAAPARAAIEPPPSDPVQRAAYFLGRAKVGDPTAQFNIAVLYARGEGVPQDYAKAGTWFREAAVNGNVAAQFNLAVLHERGFGTAKDMSEALVWYRSAAERNHAAAQYNLALAFAEGRGTPVDFVAAARWYHRAAEQGLVPAMINFAILYEKGDGVARSSPDAFAWYRAAAERGDAAGERRAGELFQQFSESDRKRADALAGNVAASIRGPLPEGPVPPRPRGNAAGGPEPTLKAGGVGRPSDPPGQRS